MEKPLVTFVMPAYNASRFISDAILSVIQQTFTKWALIVVDDGSTDDTVPIVERFAHTDSRIRLIRLPENSGNAFIPRNVAVMQSDTPWISQLDADDWIPSNYLESLFETREKYNSDAVYPTLYVMEGNGIKTRVPEKIVEPCDSGRNYCLYTLNGWKISLAGGIINSSYYKKAIEQFKCICIHSYSDELLSRLLLISLPRVALSPTPYFYRDNDGSVTRKVTLKSFDSLRNNIDLIDISRKVYGIESNEYLSAHLQTFYSTLNALYLLYNNRFDHEEKIRIINLIRSLKQTVDLKIVKDHISKKYYFLFKCNPMVAGKLLVLKNKLKPLKRNNFKN